MRSARDKRIKEQWLRGRGYPVRVFIIPAYGGKFGFFLYGSTYCGYQTLDEAVRTIEMLVKDHNKPITE